MTRAAIYARRSTSEQDASIGSQVSECESFAEAQGWQVVATYTDTASGWKEDTPRPDFDRMLREAERSDFDALVVWEVSRLSRQEDDRSALAIIWDLRGMGVEVHSVIDPRTGVKLADDMNLLIKSHMAKEESDTKSKRVRRGKRRGALNGVYQGANAPFGHRKVGKRQHNGRLINFYEPDPQDAPVLRRIVDEYLGGESPQRIADALTEEGIEPPRAGVNHRYQRRKEPVWHQSSIRHLVSNPLIAGYATYKGERIKDCECATLDDIAAKGDRRRLAVETWENCPHPWVRSVNIPGVIDEAKWERLNRTVEARSEPSRKTRGNRPETADRFLLAGLVWCDDCGERIGIRADRRKGNRDRDYYRCRGRRISGKCDLPIIEREELDEAVRAHFIEHFADAVNIEATIERVKEEALAQRNEEAVIVREELDEVEATLTEETEFRDRFTRDYKEGELSSSTYERLLAEVEPKISEAQQVRERLRARLHTLEEDFTTEDIDRVLDHINRLKEMVRGTLSSHTIPALQIELRQVFDEFRIRAQGDRIIVEPRLRDEFMPEGSWRHLDFADEDAEGVEVVEHIGAVLRKVDLTDGLVTDSS